MFADLERVIVGVADASASDSLTVVEVAAWVARAAGATIELVNGGAASATALAEICRQRELETNMTEAGAPLGDALGAGNRVGRDLVVAGKRAGNKRGLRRDLFALVRASACPVWLVHGNAVTPPRRILLATAVDELGARMTEMAASISAAAGAELHIVHAWKMPVEVQLEQDRIPRDEVERRLRGVESLVRGRIIARLPSGQVAPQIEIIQSSPVQAVRDAVTHLDPGLVVIGTAARSGLVGLVMGNTVERLYRLPCSLLVSK